MWLRHYTRACGKTGTNWQRPSRVIYNHLHCVEVSIQLSYKVTISHASSLQQPGLFTKSNSTSEAHRKVQSRHFRLPRNACCTFKQVSVLYRNLVITCFDCMQLPPALTSGTELAHSLMASDTSNSCVPTSCTARLQRNPAATDHTRTT